MEIDTISSSPQLRANTFTTTATIGNCAITTTSAGISATATLPTGSMFAYIISHASTSTIVVNVATHELARRISLLPDPDLKIRKKTVRFNKNTSPPRSEHRHERREAESYGSYSPSSKSSSTSTSSSHAAPSKSTSGSTKASSLQPQIVEKDPEERMAELMELKQMKIRQDDLLHLKDQVFQTGQNLEEKQTILDEVRAERKMLHSELNRYILMVKQVQKDLELATNAETQLTKERDQLSQYLTQLRDHDFKVLKEEVDQLRSKKGLRPLPSLEQEQEEVMGRYLEERRGQWREDGALQDSPSASSSHQSALTAVAATGDTAILFVLLKQIQTGILESPQQQVIIKTAE
ncbi:hypothetical protein BGX30_005139 [Mortierella sp. GBA39]|nr:hypothetical protein BGX30_005139 [Mortierella sp. GBA39]